MMIGQILSKLMGMECPECATKQPVMARYGARTRIRKVETSLPCPGCGTELRLAYRSGASREVVLVTLAIILVVIMLTLLIDRLIGLNVGIGFFPVLLFLMAVGLLVPVLVMGLVLRTSRKVVRS